jgi:N-acetylglucosaminyldiphosphoundecaprenol N-acetyl-beta-D-mannosaminyltransferase
MSNAVLSGRYEILGVPVDDLGLDDALSRIAGWLSEPGGGLRHVVTVNPEFVIAARRDPVFAAVLQRSPPVSWVCHIAGA